MERLRVYQLAHPDAVTEAMNLLAKALVTLAESPTARQLRDADPLRPVDRNRRADRVVTGLPVSNTYQLADEAKPATTDPGRSERLEGRGDRPKLVIPVSPAFVAVTPRRSRERVRRLAALRRLLRDWDVAGDFFTSQRERDRAERVAVLAALWRIAVNADEWLADDGPGGAVLALARGPATLTALAELSDARRELLAGDWRAGRRVLFEAAGHARAQVGRRGRWHAARSAARRSRRDIPVAILAGCAAVTVPLLLVRFLTG